MINSDLRARMLISCVMDGGDPAVAELVQNIGADGAWAKIVEGVLGEPAAQRAARVSADDVERAAAAATARYVVPGDEEWPVGLDDLRHAEAIQRRGGEPLGLWLRGPGHLAHLMTRSVAIVGSRAATAYGNGIAADLAADLVEQGVTVLSGGAFGIDVAAHRGALAAGGPTVCVLGDVSWHRRGRGGLAIRCSQHGRLGAGLRSPADGGSWLGLLHRLDGSTPDDPQWTGGADHQCGGRVGTDLGHGSGNAAALSGPHPSDRRLE